VWENQRQSGYFSIIHNGIILDLVGGFGGSVGEDVRADFLLSVGVSFGFISFDISKKFENS